MRKSFAVLAASAAAVGAFAVASPAFADNNPSGAWGNTVVIANTLTLTLSNASATITPNLGGEAFTQGGTTGQDFSTEPNTATVSSNDTSGYMLDEAVTSPFTSGSNVVPDTAVQIWDAGQGVYDTFGAAGTAVNMGQPVKVSGMAGPNNGDGRLYSDGGNDVYPIGTGLSLPGNQPAGTYQASFTFQALGN